MELEEKYLVLKRADIEAALSKQEQEDLLWLVNNVNIYRLKQGKSVNNYVVINQDEAYFPDVLRLMEETEDAGAESQAGEPAPATPLLLPARDDLRTVPQAGLVPDVPA